jgi:hypothetical protein
MAIGVLRTVVVDCLDPERLARFWAELLGTEVAFADDEWISLRAAGPGHPRVAFQKVPEAKVGKNRLHLDVWVEDVEAATVEAERIGARCLGRFVRESPEPFQVLTDPAGNEFCLVHAPGSTGP